MGSEGDPNAALQQMKDSAKGFVDLMIDGYDMGEIIKFAWCVERTEGFTTDSNELGDAIDLSIGCSNEATHLYDALWTGVGDTADQSVEDKAVVVITDGDDYGSEHTKQDVIELAQLNEIPIYTIGLAKNANDGVLKEIAAATGGLYYYAPNGEELAEIYATIAGELLGQYTISYESIGCIGDGGQASGTHELKIEVNVDDRSDTDTKAFTCPDVCMQP